MTSSCGEGGPILRSPHRISAHLFCFLVGLSCSKAKRFACQAICLVCKRVVTLRNCV